jgi:DNA-binding MarR family transcriptional regulator
MGDRSDTATALLAPGGCRRQRLSEEERRALYSGPWNVGYLIRTVSRRARDQIKVLLGEQGINIGMWPYLWALYKKDGVPQVVLGRSVKAVGPSVVSAVNQLERAGLARRVRDERDMRVANIHLTDKARALRPRIEQCVSDVNERALQFLSDEEVALLITIVEKINAGLDQDVRQP